MASSITLCTVSWPFAGQKHRKATSQQRRRISTANTLQDDIAASTQQHNADTMQPGWDPPSLGQISKSGPFFYLVNWAGFEGQIQSGSRICVLFRIIRLRIESFVWGSNGCFRLDFRFYVLFKIIMDGGNKTLISQKGANLSLSKLISYSFAPISGSRWYWPGQFSSFSGEKWGEKRPTQYSLFEFYFFEERIFW